MNSYYGTGKYFDKKLPKVHRFRGNYSAKDQSARITKRNHNVFTETNNPKTILHKEHSKAAYKKAWNSHNNYGKDGSKYYNLPRNADTIKDMVKGSANKGHNEPFEH